MILAWSPDALAQQSGVEMLNQAEEALVNIDFEQAGDLAQKALQSGELSDPKDSSRARYLVGVGHAFGDNIALAKQQFRIAISIDPELPVDTSLGPTMQSPFLEARGELAVRKEFLSADIKVEESRTGPVAGATVSDPALVAHTVVVAIRPEFYESEQTRSFSSAEVKVERGRAEVPLRDVGLSDMETIEDEISGFDLTLTIKDEFGNVIFMLGSEKLPENLGNPYFSPPTAFEELVSSPLFWIGTVAVVGAAGGLVYAFAIAPPERVGAVTSSY